MTKNKLFFLFIITFTLASFNLNAADLKIGVGNTLQPYFIKENNKGIEMEIVQEALKLKGHKTTPVYLPFARVPHFLRLGKIDCACTITESSGAKAYYSDVHITYQNYAISLVSSNLSINNIADLKNKSVLVFQNATKYLGQEFSDMAKANSLYREKADQLNQARQLFYKRTDVIITDGNIFKYFSRQIENDVDAPLGVVYHRIFPKTEYRVAFTDEAIMKDFNAGLKQIKTSGLYDKIISRYTD